MPAQSTATPPKLRKIEVSRTRVGPLEVSPLEVSPPRTADDFDRQPTPMWRLPDPKQATARIAQVLLDVMNGQRPVAQLNNMTTAPVRAQVLTSVAGLKRDQRHRPLVSSLRVTTPGPSVVEASVVLGNAGRSRAMALRLEGLDGRWICTALRIG